MMIVIIILLLAMSALFSGLTLGMFSLDLGDLERKIKLGSKKAERIYAIRKKGNFLLCTLNLGNTAINAVITTLMNEVSPGQGWIGPAISSACIFVFGEIMPQAIFSRYAFEVGAHTTWLVRIFMVLMWVVAKPLSMLLDFIFGKEIKERYNKEELGAFIEDHVGESINLDEQKRMIGAMVFSDKEAFDVITPSTILFSLDADIVLNNDTIARIKEEHYSRIPVYKEEKDNIIGILYAKDLLGLENDSKKTAEELCRKGNLLTIKEEFKLSSLWKHMIKDKVHMSFVYNEFGSLTGVVTLEDMMEELTGEEIMDESDTVADLQHQARNFNDKKTLTVE